MIKTGKELADASKALAMNHKTVYALGCFGWPMNEANQNRAINAYAYNRKAEREEKIRSATDNTFAFDCVGMIKALLWGWNGDSTKTYGGAVYVSNGVSDKSANQTIALCCDVSTDFSGIQIGEVVWMKGHIGVYIGDGLAVECTPKWADGVQITAVHNIRKKKGYNGRVWTSHGKLPYISYDNTYTLTVPVLRKGMSGRSVRALQLMLMGNGFDCGSSGADGIFGADTEKAVIACQKSEELTTDGVAGSKTVAFLLGVDHAQ